MSAGDRFNPPQRPLPQPWPGERILVEDNGKVTHQLRTAAWTECGLLVDWGWTYLLSRNAGEAVPCPKCSPIRLPDPPDFCWKCGADLRPHDGGEYGRHDSGCPFGGER